jgi:hypothetical protein
MEQYKITNKEYRDFIDMSFTRYFNEAFIPSVGTICSPSFFNRVTNRRISYTADTDHSYSESKMSKEVDDFDNYVNSEEEEDFGSVQNKLYENEQELLADQ